MQNSKKGNLPSQHGVCLSKEKCPKTPQEEENIRCVPYEYVVGSLMYDMIYTRLDICYAVGIVCRFQSNPGFDHWDVDVKHILKYFRRMKNYMLVYSGKNLIHKDTRKSTSGSMFTLGGGALVWRSTKQACTTDSAMEAKYVTACEAAK